MRSAGNFSPEWGYLAPAPSMMRTLRVVLVATAVGATAGAAVVLSLVDHPAIEVDETAAVAHAIVTSVQAATPATVPLAAAPVVAPAPVASIAAPASPQVSAVSQPASPSQPAPAPVVADAAAVVALPSVTAPTENLSVTEAPALSASRPATGIASLSDPAPANDAAPTDIAAPETAIAAPEATPPQKKTKHYASNSRNRSEPGFGSVLRNLFGPQPKASHHFN